MSVRVAIRDDIGAEPDDVLLLTALQAVRRGGVIVYLTGRQFWIATMLLGRYGRPVPVDDMIDMLWGHRGDGGPDGSREMIHHTIQKLRRKVAVLGIRFIALYGRFEAAIDPVPGEYSWPVPSPTFSATSLEARPTTL